jgi:hypothetical protein
MRVTNLLLLHREIRLPAAQFSGKVRLPVSFCGRNIRLLNGGILIKL